MRVLPLLKQIYDLTRVLFIFQLYSLNEYKPPISKAKMTQITKSGIKAIKVSINNKAGIYQNEKERSA